MTFICIQFEPAFLDINQQTNHLELDFQILEGTLGKTKSYKFNNGFSCLYLSHNDSINTYSYRFESNDKSYSFVVIPVHIVGDDILASEDSIVIDNLSNYNQNEIRMINI